MQSNNRIRVLHVIDHLSLGGAQVLLVNICENLKSLQNSIFLHEVLVLHGEDISAGRLYEKRIQVRSLAKSKNSLYRIVLLLFVHLKRKDFDILHLHLEASSFLGTCISKLLSRRPIVVTGYSLRHQYPFPNFFMFALINRFISSLVWLWEDKKDLYDIGVPDNKIRVIPIGVDIEVSNPEDHISIRITLCETYGISFDQPLLLSVARFHPNRHIHRLIDGMRRVVMTFPDAVLLMVGEGEEQERLQTLIKEYNIEKNVIFAGVRTDVWNLYAGCDVYVTASSKCDTGVAALQAMACARPTVAYSLAEMQQECEVCREQGEFIETRDPEAFAAAIGHFLQNPNDACQFGSRAREKVLEKFSSEKMILEYARLYSELVDK